MLKSEVEKNIEDFLDRLPPWMSKTLRNENLSFEEMSEVRQPGGLEAFGDAREQYLSLLSKCPVKLKEYRRLQRKLGAKSALADVPSIPAGAPRQDAVVREAAELKRSGMSQSKIAQELNLRYPDRKDGEDNPRPYTAEAIRKMLTGRK